MNRYVGKIVRTKRGGWFFMLVAFPTPSEVKELKAVFNYKNEADYHTALALRVVPIQKASVEAVIIDENDAVECGRTYNVSRWHIEKDSVVEVNDTILWQILNYHFKLYGGPYDAEKLLGMRTGFIKK